MDRQPEDDVGLERQVSKLLAGTAQYTAPDTLEQLVLARIEQRATVPWWQRRVPEWPLLAQVVFALTGIAAAAALLWGQLANQALGSVGAAPGAVLREPAAQLHTTLGVLSIFRRLGDTVAGSLPDAVWYGGILLCGIAYVALFFLIVFGYRLLQTPASR